ncbi:MAG: histidine phosphatase family protein [Eubacteriales bacterium]|nr:histidine phosphatase family protein [Eubacteriales bacterium]
MSQLKIAFYRHGETKANSQGLCVGKTNIMVSPKGMGILNELKENYEYPEVEKVFSSPAIRCLMTSSVILPGMDPEIIDTLWEVDYGDLDNLTVKDFLDFFGEEKWFNRDPSCKYPNGESYLEASFRIRSAITRVITRCIEDGLTNVAVVAHADILYNLMMSCLETDEDMRSFILCPNGMGYEVIIDTDAWFTNQKFQFTRFLPIGAKRPRPEDSPYFK